jgi:DNA-binding NarL/FixJ family response regulator
MSHFDYPTISASEKDATEDMVQAAQNLLSLKIKLAEAKDNYVAAKKEVDDLKDSIRKTYRRIQTSLNNASDLSDDTRDRLTAKQYEVFLLMRQGLAHKEIAAKLGNSVKTIECHTQAIYRTFDVQDRHQLFAKLNYGFTK